jgi:hypothetical protein
LIRSWHLLQLSRLYCEETVERGATPAPLILLLTKEERVVLTGWDWFVLTWNLFLIAFEL